MPRSYPFTWEAISEDEKAEKRKFFDNDNSMEVDMIRSTPGDVFMPSSYEKMAERIYNMELRPDDIWVVTYPKCGTTWSQVNHQDSFWTPSIPCVLLSFSRRLSGRLSTASTPSPARSSTSSRGAPSLRSPQLWNAGQCRRKPG